MISAAHQATWLQFYRLRDWEHKVNLTRLLLYVGLGVAAAGTVLSWRALLAAAFLTTLLMFAGAWSDYWDHALEGQDNPLGSLVRAGRLTAQQALGLALAPLPLAVAAATVLWRVALEPRTGLAAVGLSLFLVAYACPPLRLKSQVPIGFFAAPLGAALALLISWGAVSPWRPAAGWLALLVFVFHCYAECLHVIDDAAVPGETRKLPLEMATAWGRRLPLWSACLAMLLSLRTPLFLVGAAGGMIRWVAVRRSLAAPAQLHAMRTNVWSPIFSLPEFLIYGAAGLAHLL